ncbi:unnamed protein product [Prorocentrum cordatum]|uniref:EF-hand domain-containing protein n=1 Tax=Prorocentrum cordatum TaxID=2364126 RepID=A0ABN9V335_9DINO|nr:unnamed protein product [Polarella glacialis]
MAPVVENGQAHPARRKAAAGLVALGCAVCWAALGRGGSAAGLGQAGRAALGDPAWPGSSRRLQLDALEPAGVTSEAAVNGVLGQEAQQAGPAAPPAEEAEEAVGFWPLVLNLCGLFYMFLALMIVCDEFFVPALDVITEKTGVSPDIAGATFMAAGGSAPEFFTALVDTLSDSPSDVGIACIVGSAIFNVLFVIGMCGIFAKDRLLLTAYPLARDSAFYIVDLAVLVVCFYDQVIEWYEALLMFSLYVAYCAFMSQSEKIEGRITEKLQYNELDLDGDGKISLEEAKKDAELLARFSELDADNSGTLDLDELRPVLLTRRKLAAAVANSDEELERPLSLAPPARGSGLKAWGYYVLTFPLHLALWLTVPDVRREGSRGLFVLTFCLAILWVAKFSEIMVNCSTVVGKATPFDPRILGLTLIAAGTSVPDLLTSVLVTMQGHGDMAISSSIAFLLAPL